MSQQNPNTDSEILEAEVDAEWAGRRLDQAAAGLFDGFSRSQLKAGIENGSLTLNGAAARPRDKVSPGDRLRFTFVRETSDTCVPQDVPLNVVYRDEHLLVINKQAGLVVHPAAGNPDGTLQNGLLYLDPDLAALPRAGIVHRLDKDTTGLMVVARTPAAYQGLVAALSERRVKREYRALVLGQLTAGATIDMPIGRHPTQRTRMAVNPLGKRAVTHYRVLGHFRGYTLLKVMLETGRTHQIRVHLAHMRHPILGDPVYGGRLRLPPGASDELRDVLRGFRRQALHAKRLGFVHPVTGREMKWEVPMPEDMRVVLDALAADLARQRGAEAGWDDWDESDDDFDVEYTGY